MSDVVLLVSTERCTGVYTIDVRGASLGSVG